MSPASAVLGSGSLPFSYSAFGGGLNTYDQFDLLQDDQARDLSNVQGTVAGAIVKRGGFETLVSVTNPLTSLYATSQSYLLGVDGTTGNILQIVVPGATVSTITTGLTAGTLWQWVNAPKVAGQGAVYGMNGTDTPRQYNISGGATATWTATDAGGAVPNGRFCTYHQNQVFVSGVASNPSRVYWSGIADPTAWNPANLNGSGFEDFDPDDGEAISALGRVGPYLLVFKPTKTWVLIDPATAQTRRLSDSIGCPAFRSVASGAEGTYFLGMDQVYVTNGSKITPLSDRVQPTLDAVTLRATAAAVYLNRHYYLSYSTSLGSAIPDVTLDYDARLASWWKHSVGVNEWAIAEQPGGNAMTAYAANGANGFVSLPFQPGVYQDNGSNFTWSWSGPWQSPSFYRRRRFPTTYFRKRLRQIRFSGLGQVDFSLIKADPQFTTTPTLIKSDIFANSSVNNRAIIPGQGVARAFSLVFSGTYNSPAELDEYVLMLVDRRDGIVA